MGKSGGLDVGLIMSQPFKVPGSPGLPSSTARRLEGAVISLIPAAGRSNMTQWLESSQERDQVVVFLRCKPNIETLVVKFDHVIKRFGGAVVKVRRSRR